MAMPPRPHGAECISEQMQGHRHQKRQRGMVTSDITGCAHWQAKRKSTITTKWRLRAKRGLHIVDRALDKCRLSEYIGGDIGHRGRIFSSRRQWPPQLLCELDGTGGRLLVTVRRTAGLPRLRRYAEAGCLRAYLHLGNVGESHYPPSGEAFTTLLDIRPMASADATPSLYIVAVFIRCLHRCCGSCLGWRPSPRQATPRSVSLSGSTRI